MEAVYPACGRSGRSRADARQRRRTAPVSFADIEEVDEEQEVSEAREEFSAERQRRPDELAGLGREFAEFRRRRAAKRAPRGPAEAPDAVEPRADHPAPSTSHGQLVRASSEPI